MLYIKEGEVVGVRLELGLGLGLGFGVGEPLGIGNTLKKTFIFTKHSHQSFLDILYLQF